MKNDIDRLEMQRLLDGRMTADERALYLEYVQESDDGWKTLALAFVEERVMFTELPADAVSPVELPASTPNSHRRGKLLRQLAYLLATLAIGLFVGRTTASRPSGRAAGDNEVVMPGVQPSTNSSLTQQTGDGYYLVVTPETNAQSHDEVDNPLHTVMKPVLDQRTRDLVRDHGYRVEEEPVIYMVYDENGDNYIIPQRHVSILPEKQSRSETQ